MNNTDQYRYDIIETWYEDALLYHIPKGYRTYRYRDLYVTALSQAVSFLWGSRSQESIFNDPDNELRNAIKLWPIDKKKFERRGK